MNLSVKYIRCYHYKFYDEVDDRNVEGNTLLCYDPESDSIIKVSISDEQLDYVHKNFAFGDDVLLECVPNGRWLKYVFTA